MEQDVRRGVARRAATVLTITTMVIGLYALPAGADQFTSNNIAPTVTIVNDMPSSWDPTQTYTIRIALHDDNTLYGNTLYVCLRRAGQTCVSGSPITPAAVGTNGSYKKGAWTLTSATNSTTGSVADSDNGTWVLGNIVQVSGTYDNTDIVLDMDITISHVARAASDWRLEVNTKDVENASASDTSPTAKTVNSYYSLTTPAARNFGNIDPRNGGAPGVSANFDETVQGLKANTTWNLKLAAASTWTTGVNSISLVTTVPANNEFAMRCQFENTLGDQLTTVHPSNYIGSSATNVRDFTNTVINFNPIGGDNGIGTNSDANNLVQDTSAGRWHDLRCVIDNGFTRAGTYTGSVTATVG